MLHGFVNAKSDKCVASRRSIQSCDVDSVVSKRVNGLVDTCFSISLDVLRLEGLVIITMF